MFKRILQEPLLHFVIVGSLLFITLSSNDTSSQPHIVIFEDKIKQLSAQFSKTRQRPPMAEELNALIDNQVKEDLAFRHGVQMGLVENDTIIKRRKVISPQFLNEGRQLRSMHVITSSTDLFFSRAIENITPY